MRQSNKQANTPEPDDDPVPLDIDEFRNELARVMAQVQRALREVAANREEGK